MTQIDVLLQVAEILRSAGIPFMVAGSHGSSYYGTPRSTNDIVLAKLEWDKITPSEKQQRDVLDVLKVRWHELDKTYLRKWAHELGVAEKLEDLLGEAERLQTP
jgi:hypothetical protein